MSNLDRRGRRLGVGSAAAMVACQTTARGLCLGMIWAYQRILSPLLPRACRFEPTCSRYADEAIRRHGVLIGIGMATARVLKCHPFHPGGFDPVR